VLDLPVVGYTIERKWMINAGNEVKDAERKRDNGYNDRAIEKQWILHDGFEYLSLRHYNHTRLDTSIITTWRNSTRRAEAEIPGL